MWAMNPSTSKTSAQILSGFVDILFKYLNTLFKAINYFSFTRDLLTDF